MKILSIIVALTGLLFFSQGSQIAQAQVGGTGITPEESPVGVIPEEDDILEVTLNLAGGSCDDINAVESVVLHLKGVVAVDIESRKDHLVVGYFPNKLTPQQMVDALGKKKGCHVNIVPAKGPEAKEKAK